MEITHKELQQVIKETIRKEFMKMEIKSELPKVKDKQLGIKEAELIDMVYNVFKTGIECYGAYQFGEFLARFSHKIKNR